MWREMWDRVNRRYERLTVITQRHTPGESTEHRKDDFYSFCSDCYHLKDWLKNDPSSGISAEQVESLVTGSAELSVIADLTNGSKHLTLDRPARTGDPNTGLIGQHPDFVVGEGAKQGLLVQSAGTTTDAFYLASQAMDQWRAFLAHHHVLP